MGSFLNYWYGDQMVTFGFCFYRGSFHAYPMHGGKIDGDLTSFSTDGPTTTSYECAFRGAGIPMFFLDFRDLPSTSSSAWIRGPLDFRSIGAAYDDLYPRLSFYQNSLPREFDVVIYFQDTSPSFLLPF